ncbi:MAG: aminoacyl-tRNA hydrolase [Patescibacteria group bacterium]|jgi:PTH1 family peptidyl-tRNA hydrolase
MKFIIGLGNPGREYAKTRHNFGWLVLDALAGASKWQEKITAKVFILEKELSGKDMVLAKPTTFMNRSGVVLNYIKKKYPKFKKSDLVVVHDDKDLDFGRIKVSHDSSSAGHNGVQSIIDALGSKDFTRIRLGVKNDLLTKMPTDKFVIGRFTAEESKKLDGIIKEATEALEKEI